MFPEFVNKLPLFCQLQIFNNIVKEWVKLASIASPTRIFYIDNNSYIDNKKIIDHDSIEQVNIQTATEFYKTNLHQWIGNRSNFGIIHKYFARRPTDFHRRDYSDLLFVNKDIYRVISLVLFCPKDETLQLRQLLSRVRYHWYRKLSRSPLNSGFKSVLNEDTNTLNITYSPKQIKSTDENFHLKLDEIILNEKNESFSKLDDNLDVIICHTDLDHCLTAFLDDAFTLISSKKIVTKLNPLLVPFKLAITIAESESRESALKLYEVAEHLINLVKDYPDISIYPFVRDNLITIERSDYLAIQYIVVLNEETLKKGIFDLRNRDSRLSETIHISNFLRTLLFYLQPEKLINFKDA